MTNKPAHTIDPARHALTRIIAKHGGGICDAPKRLEALLRDLCGGHRREINVIMGAHEERVAADLVAAGNSVSRDVLLARLAARLRDHLAYTPEAARWGVETWAVALGVMSEAELKERARDGAEERGRGAAAAAPPVRDAEPPAAARAGPPQAPGPQRGTGHTPTRQQRSQQNSPPMPSAQAPASPSRRLPSTPQKVAAPAPHRHNFPAAPPPQLAPRRGRKLRSCLIVVVLIFALIVAAVFAIPAVIVLLQEEQARPSVNDPRIR